MSKELTPNGRQVAAAEALINAEKHLAAQIHEANEAGLYVWFVNDDMEGSRYSTRPIWPPKFLILLEPPKEERRAVNMREVVDRDEEIAF